MINQKTLRTLLNLSDPDRKALRKIARSGMSEEMMNLQWNREKLPAGSEDLRPDFEAIWNRIDLSTQASSPILRSRSFRILRYAAVVAIGILAFVGGRMTMSTDETEAETVEYATNRGLRSELRLPDGSTAWLNSGSVVSYSEDFGVSHRELSIEGEAVFSVQPDAQLPFIVQFGDNRLQALGTEFYISAYAFSEHASAGLIEGSVELRRGDRSMVIDEPLTVVIDPLTGHFRQQTLQKSLYSWKDGELVFEDTPLREMSHRLSNWYNQDVLIDEDIAGERFTMKITDESLEEVLTLIDLASEVSYTPEGNGYRLYAGR